MTAEFDTSRFSAVDHFFGEDGGGDGRPRSRETPAGTANTNDGNGVRGKRRGGVGAEPPPSSSSSSLRASVLNDRVLKVGRKKRSRNGGEDDDDDEDMDIEDSLRDDDDDDDNDDNDLAGGRTAITEKAVAGRRSHTEKKGDIAKNSVRKPGKKERQREKETAPTDSDIEGIETKAENLVPADRSLTDSAGKSLSLSAQSHGNDDEAGENDRGAAEGPSSSQRRKRRKVRSRQKNIRKDTRSVRDKPAHLIPGTPLYHGRPLTQATRDRISRPVPSSLVTPSSSLQSGGRGTADGTGRHNNNTARTGRGRINQHAAQSPTTATKTAPSRPLSTPEAGFIIDREPGSSTADDVGVKLASDEPDGSETKTAPRKANRDRKKSKQTESK